ncbi:MAG: hypothetical protein ACK521_01990 [bacterium]
MIADLHKKLDTLNKQIKQQNADIYEKENRIKKLSDSLKDVQLEMI